MDGLFPLFLLLSIIILYLFPQFLDNRFY